MEKEEKGYMKGKDMKQELSRTYAKGANASVAGQDMGDYMGCVKTHINCNEVAMDKVPMYTKKEQEYIDNMSKN